MTRVTYHLTDLQLERLRAKSVATGYSVAELIRQAVEASLRTAEEKMTTRRQ